MNVLDEFTGIGGFAVAARNAGMKHLGFVEIDTDCHKILRRHFPEVRIYKDVEKITEEFESTEPIDLLCGGFPCQDLSVAGRRKGLAGKRSGLWFAMLRSIAVFKPRWIVVENVPGLLSGCGCAACQGVGRLLKTHARSRRRKGGSPCAVCVAGERMLKSHSGRNFTTVIQGLVELGYGVAWRIFDSQFDGVAQRRQRVFIVGSLGNGSCAEVLFESEGGAWDHPPSREAGQRVAGAITADTHSGGFTGQNAASGQYAFGCIGNGEYSEGKATIRSKGGDTGGGSEHLIAFGGNNQSGSIDIATACNAHGGTGRIDFESETFVCSQLAGTLAASGAGSERPAGQENELDFLVTHSLRAEGCDASEDGTGRGTPLVVAPTTSKPLRSSGPGSSRAGDSRGQDTLIALTITSHQFRSNGATSGNNGGVVNLQVVPLQEISRRTGVSTNNRQHGVGIGDADDPNSRGIAGGFGVRRLTPTECERLQAFPDDYTKYDAEGNQISDSARYRMLGNAVCCATAEWILRRIMAIEERCKK